MMHTTQAARPHTPPASYQAPTGARCHPAAAGPYMLPLLLLPAGGNRGSLSSSITSLLAARTTSTHSPATMQYCSQRCQAHRTAQPAAVLPADAAAAAILPVGAAGTAAVMSVSPANATNSSNRYAACCHSRRYTPTVVAELPLLLIPAVKQLPKAPAGPPLRP